MRLWPVLFRASNKISNHGACTKMNHQCNTIHMEPMHAFEYNELCVRVYTLDLSYNWMLLHEIRLLLYPVYQCMFVLIGQLYI